LFLYLFILLQLKPTKCTFVTVQFHKSSLIPVRPCSSIIRKSAAEHRYCGTVQCYVQV